MQSLLLVELFERFDHFWARNTLTISRMNSSLLCIYLCPGRDIRQAAHRHVVARLIACFMREYMFQTELVRA